LNEAILKSQSVSRFFEYVASLRGLSQELVVAEKIVLILEKTQSDGIFTEKETNRLLERLRRLAQPFGSRSNAFLDALSLQKETDDFDARADRVHLLTLHASKGLEFPVVFIVGCEEDVLPLRLGRNSDMDEERRLLYVGMTRAQSQLYLTHAKTRMIFGKKHLQSPSRFLAAISESLVQRQKGMKLHKGENTEQLDLQFEI